MAFVAFQDVGKIYKSGEVKVQALRDATFQVEKGELCVTQDVPPGALGLARSRQTNKKEWANRHKK